MVKASSAPERERPSIDSGARIGSDLLGQAELSEDLGPIPSFRPLSLDPETGRMLPVSDEELVARREAALRMLEVLDTLTDENDTDEKW